MLRLLWELHNSKVTEIATSAVPAPDVMRTDGRIGRERRRADGRVVTQHRHRVERTCCLTTARTRTAAVRRSAAMFVATGAAQTGRR